MQAVDERLVRRADGLIQLLDPPFDKSSQNPGYIKGYVPGVRENGGQYTHAAIWFAMAFADLGDGRRAWDVFDLHQPRQPRGRPRRRSPPTRRALRRRRRRVRARAARRARRLDVVHGVGGLDVPAGLESLLGLRREAGTLRFAPCLPGDWPGYTLSYRYGETVYRIAIVRRGGAGEATSVTVDGVAQEDGAVALVDDRREHEVEVSVAGAGAEPA